MPAACFASFQLTAEKRSVVTRVTQTCSDMHENNKMKERAGGDIFKSTTLCFWEPLKNGFTTNVQILLTGMSAANGKSTILPQILKKNQFQFLYLLYQKGIVIFYMTRTSVFKQHKHAPVGRSYVLQ